LETTVIVITALGTPERAVEAMRAGAYDFIPKPLDPGHLEVVINKALERESLREENWRLHSELEVEARPIIGRSPAVQDLIRTAKQAAASNATVLLRGESGTGKEVLARAIHGWSARRAGPLVIVNCVALSEELLESELFGHEKGAFTGADARRKGIFEVADGGTLFLDEIGEISPSTQVKLLRVLQDGEFQRVGGSETIRVNVRILSATNQDVEGLVKSGRFRQDLYYRVNVFPIRVPPLRDRAEDIPLLVDHVIGIANKKLHKSIRGVSPDGMSVLISHQWPGNVRELENVVQRMMLVSKSDVVELEDVPRELRGEGDVPPRTSKDLRGLARASTELVEKQTILDALAKTGGNVTHAAKALGTSRATLQSKMKAYGLRDPAKSK